MSGVKARVYFTFRFPFRLAHSCIRTAFKVYSTADEHGRTSLTHAQDHLLDLRYVSTFTSRMRCCTRTIRSVSKICRHVDRVREPSWWWKWRNADGARMWTAEVYFGLKWWLLYSLLHPTTKHLNRLIWDILVFPCTGVDTMVDSTQLTQGRSKVRRPCQSTIVGAVCAELRHSDRNLRTAWFEKGGFKIGI